MIAYRLDVRSCGALKLTIQICLHSNINKYNYNLIFLQKHLIQMYYLALLL